MVQSADEGLPMLPRRAVCCYYRYATPPERPELRRMRAVKVWMSFAIACEGTTER